MSYSATMKSVDTEKALALLELEAKPKGAYFNFPCPKCEKGAVIKAYGEKKNVWFYPECKAKGHIISLAMLRRAVQYEEAAKFLQEKATGKRGGKITEELKLKQQEGGLRWRPSSKSTKARVRLADFQRLRASNGEIVASGEAYSTKAGAKKGITAVKRAAAKAAVVEV